jgi:protein-L-isoaspartate(D-aspartate) O-methyltransferase
VERVFPLTDTQDGDHLPLRQRQDRMVDEQIVARGIFDEEVVRALRRVPRHRFVPVALVPSAHEDRPLGIGHGQTISQPYIVAYMTSRLGLRPNARVLEVGTGCGYQAAVLAQLASEVYSVEIVPELAVRAADRLAALGYHNVRVKHGDGALGWPEHAPYDGILVTCGAPAIPPALVEQLAPGGRLICPVGATPDKQALVLVEKDPRGHTIEWPTIAVRFVPLTGPHGCDPDPER